MNIFLAANSLESGINAFSNLGSALDFINDCHSDLSPVGSALMLDTATGLVPATNKAVKDRNFTSRTLRFSSTNADSASKVAAIASKLDGAIQACVGLGIDPSNVGKIAELREDLETSQANLGAFEDVTSPTFTIAILPVHKRGYKAKS